MNFKKLIDSNLKNITKTSKRFWLIKSRRECYSIDQFALEKKTLWTGIRNYQARNFMMKEMNVDDQFLFYHSNIKQPGIFGLGKVIKTNIIDPTAFDKNSLFFDPKSNANHPVWYCVEVAYLGHLNKPLLLETLKNIKELNEMALFRKAKRLSITPLSKNEFRFILKLSEGVHLDTHQG